MSLLSIGEGVSTVTDRDGGHRLPLHSGRMVRAARTSDGERDRPAINARSSGGGSRREEILAIVASIFARKKAWPTPRCVTSPGSRDVFGQPLPLLPVEGGDARRDHPNGAGTPTSPRMPLGLHRRISSLAVAGPGAVPPGHDVRRRPPRRERDRQRQLQGVRRDRRLRPGPPVPLAPSARRGPGCSNAAFEVGAVPCRSRRGAGLAGDDRGGDHGRPLVPAERPAHHGADRRQDVGVVPGGLRGVNPDATRPAAGAPRRSPGHIAVGARRPLRPARRGPAAPSR